METMRVAKMIGMMVMAIVGMLPIVHFWMDDGVSHAMSAPLMYVAIVLAIAAAIYVLRYSNTESNPLGF